MERLAGLLFHTGPLLYILGPPHISETITARKLKFYKRLGVVKYFFGYEYFPVGGVQGVQHPTVPNVQ